jgi:glycosyltransferase XagB
VRRVYQSLDVQETSKLDLEVDLPGIAHPELPGSCLPQIFLRLSLADQRLALREKLVPVACLPHVTLYGAVGEQALQTAKERGLRVVGQVRPEDFRATVRKTLGRRLLDKAINGLKNKDEKHSAHQRLSGGQRIWAILIFAALIGAWFKVSHEKFYALLSLISGLFFLAIICLRMFAVMDVQKPKKKFRFILNDDDLPIYTVLVPVFREVRVLDQLIGALTQLKYPAAKLDIKIIMEETDIKMMRAVAQKSLPAQFDLIVVPSGKPQTKPRALNYALQFARGELLTIFDAEDIPEPLQLRKAAETFYKSSPMIACLQAELAFYNPNENWLTRQFTVEYATLFKSMLPSLAKAQLPLLLGGTSNHFRISILREVGAWDPFNVTEDADLGLRLARTGYQTTTLDSVTYEEANTELGNWLQQRARWLKGFLQTWLVHMREPRETLREIGWGGYWVMNAMTLGIVVSALFHPLLIGVALYALASGQVIYNNMSIEMEFLAALNLVVLTCGYGLAIYAGAKSIRLNGMTGWWFTLLTMPIYWVLMSIAGWMAIWQFIVRPFHWNKTRHGLSAFQESRAQD